MWSVARWLNRWEWLILLCLLPLFMFPAGLRWLVVLIIPLFWLTRKAVTGRFYPATPYNGALLLLLAMTGVGLMVSYDPALSLPKLVGVLLGVALMGAIIDYSRRFSLWPIVALYLLLGIGMAVIGLMGATWEPPFEFLNGVRASIPLPGVGIPGAVGGIVNSNELAGALGWVTPLALACCLGLGRQLWRSHKVACVLLVAATPLLAFLLIATSSRGGILALAAGVFVVLAFSLPSRWRLVLLVGSLLALAGLISYTVSSLEQDLVGDTLGLSGRIEIWSRAILAIGDFPVTGVGLNAFRRVVHELYPLFSISADIDLGHAHNHLIQAALDLGLPGLISYLAIWMISAGLLWATWKSLKQRGATRHPYYALVAGLSGSLVAGWVFGIFDAIALGSRPGFLWWMLLGFSASVHYAVQYSGERLRSRRHASMSLRLPIIGRQPNPTAAREPARRS